MAAMDIETSLEPITSTKADPPLFDFPKEEPRTFTAADLIAILSLRHAGFKKGEKGGHTLPTTEEAACKAAQDLLNDENTRKRMVFRSWPRDPNGKYITPENSVLGKMTPNRVQLWGSSLFDFYRVRRIPNLANLSTIATGSKLMKWMKAHGELDHAKDEIEWAEMEEEPKLVELWSPAEEVERMEQLIRLRKAGTSIPVKKDAKGKKVLTESPFDISNYPEPWPLVPFSYQTPSLTSIINLTHLPKKLIFHDPWNVLSVNAENRYGSVEIPVEGKGWGFKRDRTHIYKLKLSDEAKERLKEDAESQAAEVKRREAAAAATAALPRPTFLRVQDRDTDSDEVTGHEMMGYLIRPPAVEGPITPPIYVVHDPPPRPLQPEPKGSEPIEVAHLYVWPGSLAGEGNHSVVYLAEFELPRSTVAPPPSTDPILCEKCVGEDINRTLKHLDGEHGERKDPKWQEKSAVMHLIPEGRPAAIFHILSSVEEEEHEELFTAADPPYRAEFEGSVRPIYTNVEWQDPMHPTCSHILKPEVVPPTVKMRVVAKVSKQGDHHLAREAKNYEKFERHMFEHWSGFNVLPPLHDPVPVGALVPQFYGYYVPEDEVDDDCDDNEEGEGEENVTEEQDDNESGGSVDSNENEEDEMDKMAVDETSSTNSEEKALRPRAPRGYLSPILLLEDCGRDVSPRKLNIDQKNEAASMLYRFHHAGWVHGSVFERNFLVQPGPLDVPPSQRTKENPSMRLIDFGRSYHCGEGDGGGWRRDRMMEEMEIQRLLGLGLW